MSNAPPSAPAPKRLGLPILVACAAILVALGLWGVARAVSLAGAAGGFPALFPAGQVAPWLGKEASAAAISLLVLLAVLFIRRQPAKSTGWGRATLRAGLLMGAALAFLVLFLAGDVTQFSQTAWQNGASMGNIVVLCLAEETIFRGYIQLRLEWWLGKRYGLPLTALLFFIWQMPFLLAQPGAVGIVLGLGAAQALILGWLMRVGGHVLGPALYRILSTALQFTRLL